MVKAAQSGIKGDLYLTCPPRRWVTELQTAERKQPNWAAAMGDRSFLLSTHSCSWAPPTHHCGRQGRLSLLSWETRAGMESALWQRWDPRLRVCCWHRQQCALSSVSRLSCLSSQGRTTLHCPGLASTFAPSQAFPSAATADLQPGKTTLKTNNRHHVSTENTQDREFFGECELSNSAFFPEMSTLVG